MARDPTGGVYPIPKCIARDRQSWYIKGHVSKNLRVFWKYLVDFASTVNEPNKIYDALLVYLSFEVSHVAFI